MLLKVIKNNQIIHVIKPDMLHITNTHNNSPMLKLNLRKEKGIGKFKKEKR